MMEASSYIPTLNASTYDPDAPISSAFARHDPWVLHALTENLEQALCITDAGLRSRRIVYVNPAFTELTGYSLKDLAGRDPILLDGHQPDPDMLEKVHRAVLDGSEASGENIKFRQDGTPFESRWRLFPVRNHRGTVTHYVEVHQDMTEAQRWSDSMSFLRCAVEQSRDMVLMLNEDGTVIHANQACRRVLGIADNQLSRLNVRSLSFFPKRPRTRRAMISSVIRQGSWQGTLDASSESGENRVLMLTLASFVTHDGHRRYIAQARDITHQQRLEYIADAANLAENVGYVFAGLRHELGNPVNSIKTALAVVRQGLETLPPHRVASYIDSIMGEVSRVEYLLRSMATFNSTQSPVMEQVSVQAFLMGFARIIRPDVERRGVRLVVSASRAEWKMHADSRALHQVLLNLVTNALDALSATSDGTIRITARTVGQHVQLAVVDDGPGIPSERLDDIFKPFFTTKVKGTGIGLAVTRKLVTQMGGTIFLDAKRETGAAFIITLDAEAPHNLYSSATRPTWRP